MKICDSYKGRTIVMCCNTVFGMVNFRAGIIRSLIANDARVVVVAPKDSYVESLLKLGVEYIDWGVSGRSTKIFHEFFCIIQLFSILLRLRPDISLHYTIKPILYGSIVCSFLRIPFISIITGLGYIFINNNTISKISKKIYRFTLFFSDEVWLLNKDDLVVLQNEKILRRNNFFIMPGEGVNTSFFTAAPLSIESKPQFLLISRLIRDKGIFEFVDAARGLLHSGVNADFYLLGPVDESNLSEISLETIRNWENEGVIRYLGIADDVRPHIAASHCVVLPSYREGVPRSLLEASAMTRPVIATDVAGCNAVVIDGVTGLLCESRNAESLSAAINRFLSLSIEDRKKLGEHGRELVCKEFDEILVIRNYHISLQKIFLQPHANN